MIFSDIKTLMRWAWSNTTYSDNLSSIHSISDEVINITNNIFERLHIANKNMDGHSVIGLGRVDVCERNNPVVYSEIFNNMVNGGFVSSAYYSAKITASCLENEIEDENLIYGYICRGLRTLASFFREMDLEDKLKSSLIDSETTRNANLDISEHTDILIRCNGKEYRIWSYQDTDIGIRNGVSKLRGERGGEIPDGIHILCPLSTSDHDCWYGWWLYPQSTVNAVIQKMNEDNTDNYDEILNNDVCQYMKNVNIFIKG